jgi:RND family efflux transporter MFP subunit
MKESRMPSKSLVAFAAVALCGALAGLPATAQDKAADKSAAPAKSGAAAIKPALTVTLVQGARAEVPVQLAANGSVAAWQEAILGAEVNGLRLAEVRAQVGDAVRRGQVLAVFAAETTEAEVAQAKASVAEAEATMAEAKANAERAQSVAASGALSAQQIAQYATAEKTAQARLELARAQLVTQQLRLRYTKVTASDDGIISARSATVGAVVPQGQELFRLIRKGRLEWRGEVTATELGRLKAGLPVAISAAGVGRVEGRLRMVGPTVDAATRNALVYVDLPDAAKQGFKPGMFARGEFGLGSSSALTVPQESVVLRDGFAYVFRAGPVQDGQAKVARVKVETGRRVDNRVEVLSGIALSDRIVGSGVAFLADGDTVKVVAK